MSADISSSRSAFEADLRTREQYLALVFNSAREMMLLARVEPGVLFRIVSVNRPYVETIRAAGFGFSAQDFEGRTFAESVAMFGFDAATTGEMRARYEQVIRTHQPLEYKETTQTPAGTFHGHTTLTPILDETGDCRYLLYSSLDVTERLRAEQALRESEEKFAKAFRASPHPFIISELETGRFVDVNLGFERLTGYGREEVIGRTSLELGFWDNPEDRLELTARLQRDGMVRDMELRFRRKYGEILVTRCSFESIELAGRRCMLSTVEDITEQRRAEDRKAAVEARMRQNQKLEALGTLAGGIAHDFNNILTAIIVNQELAVMDVTNPAMVRQRLAEIGRASNRAKELVRQILTFSRQQQHERLKQRLQPIILEALGLLRSSLPATIEMEQAIASEAPPVLADASQVHQVVMNLCTNAAHAMSQQPGRLTVRLALRSLDAPACLGLPGLQPGRYAQLTVTDTGQGMEAAVLARIFEPFFTTKGPGEGTGLGLPMVHGIMQGHDGGIFVQSLPGVGTTFDLYFPEATQNGAQHAVADTDIVPGRGESVLVVDDEAAIGQAISAMLRKIGYRVQALTDPRLALERFRARPAEFDLLLTDRTMPQLSGPELIAQIREWWPDVPVLLMSGLDSVATKDAAESAGYRLVTKPIDIAELSRAVRQALLTKPTR